MAQMAPRADLPFQKVGSRLAWILHAIRASISRPVNTGFLLQSNWWQQNSRQGQMQEDLAMMAQYMRDEFKTAFANDPYHLSGGGGPAARFPDP